MSISIASFIFVRNLSTFNNSCWVRVAFYYILIVTFLFKLFCVETGLCYIHLGTLKKKKLNAVSRYVMLGSEKKAT